MAEGITLNEVLNFENTLLAELKSMAGIETEVTLADVNQLFKSNILLLLRAIKAQGIGTGTGGTGLTTTQSNALSTLITALESNKELSDENFTTEEKELLGVLIKDGDGKKYLADDGLYKTVSGGSSSILEPVADLAALKAINTTAFTTVKEIQVQSLGKYKFQPASTLTGDDANVITPTTGSSAGRWIKQSVDVTEITDFDLTKKNITTIKEGTEVLKPKLNRLSKNIKIVMLGSSVMKGQGATTEAQGYANLLRTSLESVA